MAASILSILEPLAIHARTWALIGDESWFYFSCDYEGKWVLAREASITKRKPFINTPKIIVLVMSGWNGLALVEIVPSNLRASLKYLCKFAIPQIEANMKAHRPKHGLKCITFHLDNASSHTAKVTISKISELRMNQMPYLPYSPDIVPRDFFLFIYLKHMLQGCSHNSTRELFCAITDLMKNLKNLFLHGIFDQWISCLYVAVESGGEYIQTCKRILLVTQ
jgi:hypothetical protein